MSDLSQHNNGSTVVAENTDVYLDWDSGNKSQRRITASALQKNYFLPPVSKKKTAEVRQQLQIELIRGAQQGNMQCLEQLAQQAKDCLQVYVYRLTQQHELSQEIVQESLVELFEVIGTLREPDSFWPWLYGIAINKLRRYNRTEQKHRTIAMSSLTRTLSPEQSQSGFENLVGEELKQILCRSMNALSIRYKDVLIMRCYDDMAYSEISESLSSSEVSTRMLFVRAKRALQKELSRNGFDDVPVTVGG